MGVLKSKKFLTVLIIFIIITGVCFFLAMQRIENIEIEGNEKLDEETIKSYIFSGEYDLNPLVLKLKLTFGEKVSIPFVEDYDIEFESWSSIKLTVYEKSIVGYISYMGTYMYFDKDGIVVENTEDEFVSVPKITGIRFDSIVLYDKMPVDSDKVFDMILEVTQLTDKYDMDVERIDISDDMDIVLYIGSYKVELGNNGDYGGKMAALYDILPNMQDIPGTLDMTEYDTSGYGYVFKKD